MRFYFISSDIWILVIFLIVLKHRKEFEEFAKIIRYGEKLTSIGKKCLQNFLNSYVVHYIQSPILNFQRKIL